MDDRFTLRFDDEQILTRLQDATDDELNALDFGIIGFDAEGMVRRYNTFESKASGLSLPRVLDQSLFTVVAPCMNNFLVAQRFVDATEAGEMLDDTIDYVLTLRMRPTRVKLRLLADPSADLRYVLVHRLG